MSIAQGIEYGCQKLSFWYNIRPLVIHIQMLVYFDRISARIFSKDVESHYMAQQHSLDLPWESDSSWEGCFFLRVFYILKSKFVNTLLQSLRLRDSLQHLFKPNTTCNMSIPSVILFDSAYINSHQWQDKKLVPPTYCNYVSYFSGLPKEWKPSPSMFI
jgi:hypothetical protein